jgi:hypothetical protein
VTRLNIAVFDIDGVIADSWHRRAHIRKSPPDWDTFNSLCGDDPILPLAKVAHELGAAGWSIYFVTTRPETVRVPTEQWLLHHGLIRPDRCGDLFMYDGGEPYQGAPWKVHVATTLIKNADTALVFEDDPQIIRMYRLGKIPVVPIFSGYYEWRVRP